MLDILFQFKNINFKPNIDLMEEVEKRNDIIFELLESFTLKHNLRETQYVCNDINIDNVALIIEPRKHRFFELVIRNVMYFLNKNDHKWNLHVVTCSETRDWLTQMFPEWNIQFTILNESNLNQQQYNNLIMSEHLWNGINEENVLVFQTDTMMFRSNIEDFMHYDFIGANFFDPNDASLHHGGNNGGFSFRHKSAMVECINKVSPSDVQRYLVSNGRQIKHSLMEDVYFTNACEILGKTMSTIEERKTFSIEDATQEYYLTPIGCHRFASGQLSGMIFDLMKEAGITEQNIKYSEH